MPVPIREYPKPPHRGEIIGGPDSRGAFTYFLYWMDDYFPGHPEGEYVIRERGQIFRELSGRHLDDESITWTDKR